MYNAIVNAYIYYKLNISIWQGDKGNGLYQNQ